MESKKKLLIADADESFRSILMDAMRDEADMEVLAATGDGEEALRLVRELSPERPHKILCNRLTSTV